MRNSSPTAKKKRSDGVYMRQAGLLRRWELERLIVPGDEFRVEDAGFACDGTPLFALYRRRPESVVEVPAEHSAGAGR
jgi:hypothetical protein